MKQSRGQVRTPIRMTEAINLELDQGEALMLQAGHMHSCSVCSMPWRFWYLVAGRQAAWTADTAQSNAQSNWPFYNTVWKILVYLQLQHSFATLPGAPLATRI